MKKEKIQFYILKYFTPILLIIVAFTHIYYSKSAELTPWKGGGFGMFCTVDSKQARFFRLYLIDENGDKIPASMPTPLKNDVSKLKAIPTPSGLEKLVDDISEFTWIDTSLKKRRVREMAGIQTEILDSQNDASDIIRVKSINKFDEAPSQDEIIDVRAILLEYWRYTFDKDGNVVLAKMRHSVNKPIQN